SRRRHTIFSRDWSSDVCSSDLWNLPLEGGVVIANPISPLYSMDRKFIDDEISKALDSAKKDGISGKDITPYLLSKIKSSTEGAKIGRASCRERVKISEVDERVK